MPYDPDHHHRRSIRLQGYNYSSAGAYFITLCTFQRQCLFGQIIDGVMQLNECGQIVFEEWLNSSSIRQEIEFDQWVIMPNHLHGIVLITPVGAHGRAPLPEPAPRRVGVAYRKPRSLSSFVAGFKSATTKRINTARNSTGTPVWQRNYYEHIIRSEASCQRIRQYIHSNPATWQDDQLHPSNPSKFERDRDKS
ncbi:transposase [Halomicronema sp. CCY15110]|uniref:transposase n=1 Tax=Halomicronema sp. CCY15110 TaxID=2767773 RepID=UPI0019514947